MNYQLLKELLELVEEFDALGEQQLYEPNLSGFKQWLGTGENTAQAVAMPEPDWEGKSVGRSMDSVINTLVVHLGRYAKLYAKSAIYDSEFSTQEEFIYLINLKAFGAMSKMDLIRRNVQDKPVGMQIINRLIKQGWVEQELSAVDKRSKIIFVNAKGLAALEEKMNNIRQATALVTGRLNVEEKLQLIHLLQKLETFHQPIYAENLETSSLLDTVYEKYILNQN